MPSVHTYIVRLKVNAPLAMITCLSLYQQRIDDLSKTFVVETFQYTRKPYTRGRTDH